MTHKMSRLKDLRVHLARYNFCCFRCCGNIFRKTPTCVCCSVYRWQVSLITDTWVALTGTTSDERYLLTVKDDTMASQAAE